MFTSVQLCANRKTWFSAWGQHNDMSWHVSFPNNTDKKKGKGETDVELTLQCLIRGTAKNPFDWSTGFPAHTPVHSPWQPDTQNNVNIENISLKNDVEWPHRCDGAAWGTAPHVCAGSVQEATGSQRVAVQGRHQLQNKQCQPRPFFLTLFHMKVCKKQVSK